MFDFFERLCWERILIPYSLPISGHFPDLKKQVWTLAVASQPPSTPGPQQPVIDFLSLLRIFPVTNRRKRLSGPASLTWHEVLRVHLGYLYFIALYARILFHCMNITPHFISVDGHQGVSIFWWLWIMWLCRLRYKISCGCMLLFFLCV